MLPVLMGVATIEEVEVATRKQLEKMNYFAKKKQELIARW